MNYLPSKELLSELGYGEVTYIGDVVELYEMQCLPYRCNVTTDSGRNDGKTIITSKAYHIALEVIAHKCKEWAIRDGYRLNTYIYRGKILRGVCEISKLDWFKSEELNSFDEGTEAEAIFLACQWIIDNRS